jgi:hypothetical protein
MKKKKTVKAIVPTNLIFAHFRGRAVKIQGLNGKEKFKEV